MTPCQRNPALFDSTDWSDHHRARDLCATCPILADCFTACRHAVLMAGHSQRGPVGTWAGELMTDARYRRMKRSARELQEAG